MKLVTAHEGKGFEIIEDHPEVGFYIYVFNAEGKCIADYLQETEIIAKEFVFEEYNVSLDSWKKV